MITREQAIQALREIKEVCMSNANCRECPLNNDKDICPMNITQLTSLPCNWNIPEESSNTEENKNGTMKHKLTEDEMPKYDQGLLS